MKKLWEWKYPSRLYEAMNSEDHALLGSELFFVHMTNGSFPNSGIYCVDTATSEGRTIIELHDFLRNIGASDGQAFYFTSLRGDAYCVTRDGAIRWTRQLGETPGSACWDVALDNGRLYMAQDALYCIDPATGNTIWAGEERDAKNRINALLVEKTHAYCARQGHSLACIDKTDGKTVWTYDPKTWWRNVISFDEHTLLCTDTHGRLLFIDKRDGQLIQSVTTEGELMRRPVLSEGNVLVGENLEDSKGQLTCYAVDSGYSMKPQFKVPAAGEVTSEPVVCGNRLFFGTEDGSLYCIQADTGAELEKKRKVKGACRGIVPCGDTIIALSDKGPVTAFSTGR